MRILLVSPPQNNMISTNIPDSINSERGYAPPLGLLYIASYLKKYSKHKVKVLDTQPGNMNREEILSVIKKFSPDISGVQCLSHTLVDALNIFRIIKEYSPKIITIAGGPHVSAYPEETLVQFGVDFVIQGEAERSFTKLVDILDNKQKNFRDVKGLFYKNEENKTEKGASADIIENLDILPVPERTLTDYEKYYSLLSHHRPITTMMTSRGCPYNCSFCSMRLGKKFRAHSPERVVEEIGSILELGIKEIFIHDDTFSVNKSRVHEICSLIKRRKIKIPWDARVRVDNMDFSLLKAMKDAGCVRLSMGVESGSEKVLKKIKKGINLKKTIDVFDKAKKLGITTLADFMIGLPGEGEKEFKETINFAKKLKASFNQFSITIPYPETALYKEGLERGIIEKDFWKEYAEKPDSNFKPPLWTENYTEREIINKANYLYKKFYLTPSFILKNLLALRSLEEFKIKMKAGIKLLKKGD